MKNTINIILNGFMNIWNFLAKFFTSSYMMSILYKPFIKYLLIITAVIVLIAIIAIISIKAYKLILKNLDNLKNILQILKDKIIKIGKNKILQNIFMFIIKILKILGFFIVNTNEIAWCINVLILMILYIFGTKTANDTMFDNLIYIIVIAYIMAIPFTVINICKIRNKQKKENKNIGS